MFTKRYYIPILIMTLIVALCLVRPVYADDGSTAGETDSAATAVTASDDDTVIQRDSGNVSADGDPRFKVGTTWYNFYKTDSGVDCSTDPDHCKLSDNPIQAALDYMSTNSITPSDRKLYIEADEYEETVLVDGTQPGLSGLTGLVGEGDTAKDVQIKGTVYIHDMASGFSISNLTVSYTGTDVDTIAIKASNNKGVITLTDVVAYSDVEDGTGIYINQIGNVVLNRVDSSGNGYQGANISATGSITINASSFNANLRNINDGSDDCNVDGSYWAAGLLINALSTSPVTLNAVSVMGNIGDGVDLYASKSTVTVKNSLFQFNGAEYDEGEEQWIATRPDWGDGLFIYGNVITLENIESQFNGIRGIFAQAYSTFSGTRLYANQNLDNGIQIKSCITMSGSTLICGNSGAGTVVLKAIETNENGGRGIYINAKGGITLYDINLYRNGLEGLVIDNSNAPTAAPVVLTLVNSNENTGSGIEIITRGAVTGTNVVADTNGEDGITIESRGNGAINFKIDTSSPGIFNSTVGNTGNGFTVINSMNGETVVPTASAVSIISLDSAKNGGYGVLINNSAAAAPVTIKVADPTSTVCGFVGNAKFGLNIISNGVITLSNVEASGNQDYGAYISNVPLSGSAKPAITITNGAFSESCIRNESGDCIDDSNYTHYGLEVHSLGLITINRVTAASNYGDGVVLDNSGTSATAGVTLNTITGKGNVFQNNKGNGLTITTNGPVAITNITANGNNGDGANIDNSNGTGAVNIKQVNGWNDAFNNWWQGNTFSNNTQNGLNITSKGAVNVAFYRAQDNIEENGILILANGGTGAVTLTGMQDTYRNTSGNGVYGVRIDSQGNIALTNIESHNNGDTGIYLRNDIGAGTVTLTNVYADNNQNGLSVFSNNSVTWKYGSANGNFESGAYIYNQAENIAGKPVTVTNVSTCNNGESGLGISSKGAVTLTNVNSSNNSANNFTIENGQYWTDNLTDDQVWKYDSAAGGTITITLTSGDFTPSFYLTDIDGNQIGSTYSGTSGSAFAVIDLPSGGSYVIHIFCEDGNFDGRKYSIGLYEGTTVPEEWSYRENISWGIMVDNHAGTNAPVTITNPSWDNNSSNNGSVNVQITSSGVVTINNLQANEAGEEGLVINNSAAAGSAAVTLKNVSANSNDQDGISITSKGAVTISDTGSYNNDGSGIDLTNSLSGTAPVSLKNVGTNDNDEIGTSITSLGVVTLYSIDGYNNGDSGITVQTNGAVVMTKIYTGSNGQYGLSVNTPSTVTLNKSGSGYNQFVDNEMGGMNIIAGGKVTLTNVNAGNNGRWAEEGPTVNSHGISIDNTSAATPQPILLTDISANNNTLNGIDINTNGAVTVTQIYANENYHDGLSVVQNGTVSTFAISVSKSETNRNGWHGILVSGNGNITLSRFQANENNGDAGVTLNNASGTGTVTILNPAGGKSANMANSNHNGNGVTIYSNGAVTVTGLEVSGNQQNGIEVVNNAGGPTRIVPVTLNSIIARGNTEDGILVTSNGIVTINNSWSLDNNGNGLTVSTPGNAFINNTVTISNGYSGMYIDLGTTGALKLTNSYWYGNTWKDDTRKNLDYTAKSILIL